MKNISPGKRLVLPLALSSAVLPVILIGCGGGNGNGPSKTRPGTQPTATIQPTGTTPTGTALPELSFTFDNGQRARFFAGTLSPSGIVNAQITVTGAQSAPLQVPPGTYPVTGTLNPTTGKFTLSQGAGSPYKFNVTGTLPTQSANGTFTFTAANGQAENGVIPRGTVVIPTTGPTTAPTTGPTTAPTTVPGNFKFTGALTATNPTFDFAPVPIAPFNYSISGQLTGSSSGAQSVNLVAASGAFNTSQVRRDFEFKLRSSATGANVPFTKNQIIDLKSGNDLITIKQFDSRPGATAYSVYFSNSGQAIVRDIGTNSITLELKDALFVALFGVGTGKVTLNGTVTATGLTTN